MICLFQLTLEERSIMFPIHEVYNKRVHCSCSQAYVQDALPGASSDAPPGLETHTALPENSQSKTQPAAQLPPPPTATETII